MNLLAAFRLPLSMVLNPAVRVVADWNNAA
jgi:hypothetical protein